MDSYRAIAGAATDLATSLPTSTIETVAETILTSGINAAPTRLFQRIPHHHHRDLAMAFVLHCQQFSTIDASAVAMALRTAALAKQQQRDSQSVELVWTGPETKEVPFRRTEQAILQLLCSARDRITLVSFAVYHIPNIAKALVNAAQRGVKLTVILETPDKLGGENEYSTLRALGAEVEACSTVYYWPKEKRKLSDANKPGLLHVKCAVADGEWLFLSSANLTQQAFTINMELGVLIRGGAMPGQVEEQFEQLVNSGILVDL